MKQLTDEDIEQLAEMWQGEPQYDPPPDDWGDPVDVEWHPNLSPSQKAAWDDATATILLVGEKASGKTLLGLAKGVRHCYESSNALMVICAVTTSVAAQGPAYELENTVLPWFRDGNRHPPYMPDGATPNPKAGQLMDRGIGLKYTTFKTEPLSKDRYLYIQNRFGGVSTVVVKTILHRTQVQPRFTGITPSFVYFEEITEADGEEYYVYTKMQLGRRQGTTAPHQWVGSCNPKGPSHWAYKAFMVQEATEKNVIHPAKGFAVHRIPYIDNCQWVSKDYVQENIERPFRNNPVELMRLREGLWVDRPSGEAIFKDVFIPDIHVIGNDKGIGGIIPPSGYLVGYDPGPVNYSVTFVCPVLTTEGIMWLVFDEVDLVGCRMQTEAVAKRVLMRMEYWAKAANVKPIAHVFDEAGFTHRNARGSFDAKDMKDATGGRVIPKACPKGANSAPARVKLLYEVLAADMIRVSGHCKGIESMLLNQESEEPKGDKYDIHEGMKPKQGIYKHRLDSLTYAMLYYNYNPAARRADGGIKPQYYRAGG